MDLTWALNPLAALAPALVLLVVFASLDVFKLLRFSRIVLLILAGGALALTAYFANAAVMEVVPLRLPAYSRYVAPVVEEGLKAALVIALFTANRIGFKLDAVVIGFAVGAGFSTVENLWYLHLFSEANTGVAMVRGFGTAVMHGGATALFATISHEMTERQAQSRAAHYRFNPLLFVPGLLAAFAVHSAFNHFTDHPLPLMVATMLATPFTLFVVFSMGERSSHKWLLSDNEAHQKVLEDIRSGHFERSETGQAVLRLLKYFPKGTVAAEVFHYIELHTELVIRAEQILLARRAGSEPEALEEDRAKFRRLRELERHIGPAALAALRPHLHFTRNDLWEMYHFEEHARPHEEAAQPRSGDDPA